jgi:DNA polymerase III delta prime subunit
MKGDSNKITDNSIFITEQDDRYLQSIAKLKPHAVMLVGYYGSNLNKIIEHFILKLKQNSILTRLDLNPIEGRKKISIDSVRELNAKLKLSKKETELSIVVIEQANALSLEAATALLKILEEPNRGTMFILGVGYQDQILPTIASRCYKLKLKKPNMKDLSLGLGLELVKLKPLMMLCGGRLDTLVRIIDEGDSASSERQILEDAKKWVTSKDKLERLEISDKYSELDQINDFIVAIAGVQKSLVEHFIDSRDFKLAQNMSKKAMSVDTIIRDTSYLNLNKRVIQIELSNI